MRDGAGQNREAAALVVGGRGGVEKKKKKKSGCKEKGEYQAEGTYTAEHLSV